jgi:hypothetical protein
MAEQHTEAHALMGDLDLLEQARGVARCDLDADEYFAAVDKRAAELVDREASHPWSRRSRAARQANASSPFPH